ncbi:MAG: hypothetical protein NT031_16595 [Planctomycetota bacterium]|nr:hypothetical protein [Planctomycetota bacterium]
MNSIHPIPDPATHPDFREPGRHWVADSLAALDMALVGVLMVAAVGGFWMALAWAIFRR